jgi:hypothetical protein
MCTQEMDSLCKALSSPLVCTISCATCYRLTIQAIKGETIYVLSVDNVLVEARYLVYDDAQWLNQAQKEQLQRKFKLVHNSITPKEAALLGVSSLRERLLQESARAHRVDCPSAEELRAVLQPVTASTATTAASTAGIAASTAGATTAAADAGSTSKGAYIALVFEAFNIIYCIYIYH